MKTTVYLLALLCTGALFGFFFTMSVSIMPGLDLAEPYSALVANQAIGNATQQSLFAVALLGTPITLIILLVLMWRAKLRDEGSWISGAMLAFIAMMVVTLTLNVPLNQILDALPLSEAIENPGDLWLSYSVDWQKWNWLRVLFSGLSVLALGRAMLLHGTERASH